MNERQFWRLVALGVVLTACGSPVNSDTTPTIPVYPGGLTNIPPTFEVTPSATTILVTKTLIPSETPKPTITKIPTITLTETLQPTLTVEEEHPGWTEALAEAIGPDWNSYKYCGERITIKPSCDLSFVTDGEFIYDLPLKAGDELLATATISINGFYLDNDGKLQKVIVPQILQLPDGREIKLGVDFMPGETARAKEYPPRANGGLKGFIIHPYISEDIDAFAKIDYHASPGDRVVYQLVKKYNEANKENWERFMATGYPGIEMILPLSNANGIPTIVDLP